MLQSDLAWYQLISSYTTSCIPVGWMLDDPTPSHKAHPFHNLEQYIPYTQLDSTSLCSSMQLPCALCSCAVSKLRTIPATPPGLNTNAWNMLCMSLCNQTIATFCPTKVSTDLFLGAFRFSMVCHVLNLEAWHIGSDMALLLGLFVYFTSWVAGKVDSILH